MKREDIKIGDTVWYRTICGLTGDGTVTEINIIDEGEYKGTLYAVIDDGGIECVKLSDIFSTEEELISDSKKRFAESVKNVNDLVRFMYNHMIHSAEEYEYIAGNVRQAVRWRAKELLGIDLGE